jgi:hypothetical protein
MNMHIMNCHIQKTQPPYTAKKKIGKESMVYKMTNFKTDTINNKNETVSGKTNWGLNQVLWCTNLTPAPTGSQMNKQVQAVLVK